MKGNVTRGMRQSAATGALVLLAAAALLSPRVGAQAGAAETSGRLPPQWRHWKYFRAIRLPTASAPRLVALLVPERVYARTQDHLADLRLIDDRGIEVPYARIIFSGASRTTFLPSHRLERRYVPDRYSDFILDLGSRPSPCNFLSVAAKATAANLAVLAEIDSSSDGSHWRKVRKSAALFGSEALSASTNPVLHFPETTARFLRLRIFYGKGSFSLRTMAAGNEREAPADRIPVTGSLVPSPSARAHTTAWQISLDAAIPVDEADFQTTQPQFSRQVTVFLSEDGATWRRAGEGMISRVLRDGEARASLSVGFPPVRCRLWRVEVANESDPPLANLRLRLSMTPERIVFRQRPGRAYRLLYGESQVRQPQYDLEQTVPESSLRDAPLLATLQAERTNVAWEDPRPWSEKHSAVLWLATLVAALLLGLAALRSIRRPA